MHEPPLTNGPPGRNSISSGRIAHLTTIDLSLRFLLLPQLQAMQAAGYEVVGLSAPGPWRKQLLAAGVEVIDIPELQRGQYGLSDLRAMRQIAEVLRRERFDLLHTHTPKAGLLGRLAARAVNQRHIVHTIHGLPANNLSSVWRHALVWAIERVGACCSEHVLLQNAEDLETVRRTLMVSRSRCSLLGNGVDLQRFSPDAISSEQQHELRQQLNISPKALVVGMVARLIERKGFLEFFECAKRLRAAYPGCVFLCAGPLEPSQADGIAKSQLQSLQDQGIIRYVGMRTDIERLYALMDIAVLPSYFPEGVPRSLMEPAAMGKPLVTTNMRGCRNVVQHGVNGLLVPAQNPSALTEAVRQLLADPNMREDMGRASRRLAEDRFDERLMARRTIELYDRLLKN